MVTDGEGEHGHQAQPETHPKIPPRSASLPDDGASTSRMSAAGPRAPLEPSSSSSEAAPTLAGLRQSLVDEIVADSRREGYYDARLSAEGKSIFKQAGFQDRIDQRGDVEVRTKWLKPVVQERVVMREHTEYRTEITRHLHEHHVYPTVQPIHDPDPLVLPSRHRMFSSSDNQWHEVIGDEAAIAILGENVFRNGPQQTRNERKSITPEEEHRIRRHLEAGDGGNGPFMARVIEREGEESEGSVRGDWRLLGGNRAESKPFNGRDFKDGLDDLEGEMRTLHVQL